MNTIVFPSSLVAQATTRTLRRIRTARLELKRKLVEERMAKNNRWYVRWFGIGRVTREQAEVEAESDWEYLNYGYSWIRLCKQLLDLCQVSYKVTLSVEDAHKIGVHQDVDHR